MCATTSVAMVSKQLLPEQWTNQNSLLEPEDTSLKANEVGSVGEEVVSKISYTLQIYKFSDSVTEMGCNLTVTVKRETEPASFVTFTLAKTLASYVTKVTSRYTGSR